jgi:hypothetical protein
MSAEWNGVFRNPQAMNQVSCLAASKVGQSCRSAGRKHVEAIESPVFRLSRFPTCKLGILASLWTHAPLMPRRLTHVSVQALNSVAVSQSNLCSTIANGRLSSP